MNYEEFNDFIEINDNKFKLLKAYRYPSGEQFFIEPAFYTQLMSIKEIYPDIFPKVFDQMGKVVIKNKKVGFVFDFEKPFIEVDGFIYLEIKDITDAIKFFYEDKSRGSDYGD